MKIPKYWANTVRSVAEPEGRTFRLSCWGWSDVGTDDARQKADARVSELAQKVLSGAQLGRYAYGQRPLREEVTQSVPNRAGKEVAVVTRNAYGALILNAANAMFIDVDFGEDDTAPSLPGPLQSLLGAKSPSREEHHRQRISAWAGQHPDLSLRVYRTFAGLRCLITNQTFDPSAADSASILQALDSDPLYIRLCQAQACFRARLTPKPWRCGMDQPASRYPWESAAAEARHRQWEQRYQRAIAPFSVCKLIWQTGAQDIHPDVEPVLSLHDQLALSGASQKLA